jgi:hypothetical protein
MRFICLILLGFRTSTKDPIQSLDWLSPLFLLLPPVFSRSDVFYGSSIDWMQNPFSTSKCFPILDWILRSTLFHRFDTLGSHLREEWSLDYDGELVRFQVQTNFDTTINCQRLFIIYC